jgi:hypothetical protein
VPRVCQGDGAVGASRFPSVKSAKVPLDTAYRVRKTCDCVTVVSVSRAPSYSVGRVLAYKQMGALAYAVSHAEPLRGSRARKADAHASLLRVG